MYRKGLGYIAGMVAVVGATTAGALVHAGSAWAEPQNCSVADFAGTTAGVSASMSAYLFAHPDTNAFLSSLQGMSRTDAMSAERHFYERNPGVEQDLAGIRQPLTDLRSRCGGVRSAVDDGADVNAVAFYVRPSLAPQAV